MRKLLLLLCALFIGISALWADNSVLSGKYYIKNVASGQYLAAGADWGTRAILNETGLDIDVTALENGTYTLDTNVSNGGEQHYLLINGDNFVYTDGVAFEWTIEGTEDALTLSNGGRYLIVNENGILDYTENAGDAALWKFETLEDRLATLATATAYNVVDATFLIEDANFNRNDLRKSAWTFEASNQNIGGGDVTNFCAESWHSTFSISQVIANAPAGIYKLSAQGFWRQDGSDNENLPYFFANDEKATFPVMAGTENSMTDASHSFTKGLYTVEFIVEVAEDGALTIGAKNDANLNIWCIFDNFRLTYYGNETTMEEVETAEAYRKALASINTENYYRFYVEQNDEKYYLKANGYLTGNKDEAHNFTLTPVTGNYAYGTGWDLGCKFTNPSLTGGSTGDIVNDGHIHVGGNNRNDWERQVLFLNDEGKYAVRATNATGGNWGANTYWDVFEGETLPEAGYSLEPAYVWQLLEITQEVIDFENALKNLKNIIANGNALAEEQGDGSIAALDAINIDAIETLDAANEAIATAKAAIADYITAIEVADVVDITTGVMVNATPIDNLDGWEGTPIGGHDNGVAEYWNVSPAGFHQTITLPAGEYRLTAIALTRTGMHGTIYAGENSVEIATVANTVVNSRAQAASWFAAGNGVNELYFVLKETTDVEIGLKADETTGDHWTVWQSFKLEKCDIDRMMAVSTYTTALDAAKALLANESVVGGDLFQKSLLAYNALNVAVMGWDLNINESSTYKLEVATEALNKAIEAYNAVPVNTPEENVTYIFRQKASGLYLSVSAETDNVVLSEEPQAFTWTAVEGGYYLHNEEGYVGLAGGNAWTMSAAKEKAVVITATPVVVGGEVYYTLDEKNGVIGTDTTEAGANCWANKTYNSEGDRALWTIEKAGSSQVGGNATAIEGVATEAEKNDIFDLNGHRVSKAQKGVYIINGKKVLK